jgi:uncharacterized OB-fold protein
MLPLLKPTLYNDTDAGPVLLGGRCSCGHVFFPMQTFGCERCGKTRDALQPHVLKGRGTLITASVVHMHADKRRSTPFAVGTVALDEGPVIRTLLSDVELAQKALQKTVEAEWVQVTLEDGSPTLDLRFRRETKDTASAGEK